MNFAVDEDENSTRFARFSAGPLTAGDEGDRGLVESEVKQSSELSSSLLLSGPLR
jgi:hypothetical protein